MLPTLKPGDTVLVWRFGKPKVGDIVVAKHDGKFLIKRVGKIENHRYFLIGDNTTKSTDSRQFGEISRKEIIGVVFNSFIL